MHVHLNNIKTQMQQYSTTFHKRIMKIIEPLIKKNLK